MTVQKRPISINTESSPSVPEHKHVGFLSYRCMDRAKHVVDKITQSYKGSRLDRGKGPID